MVLTPFLHKNYAKLARDEGKFPTMAQWNTYAVTLDPYEKNELKNTLSVMSH